MLAAAMLVAIFTCAVISGSTAHAATDAKWKGDAIVYQDHTYKKLGADQTKRAVETGHLPSGATVYQYLSGDKAHLIYFNDSSDPPRAEAANYVVYDYNVEKQEYTNPTSEATLTLAPKTNTPPEARTSCVIDGIGWIICPVTDFLASSVDWLFGVLSTFLEVQPLSTNQDNSLFHLWSMMRDFANVAFVIGFMVVIYSQLTNAGLSNYGIKRVMPRLIVAAILVNISYWVCAIAIDVSNILGHAVEGLFIGMRNQVTSGDHNSWGVAWSDASNLVLTGGLLGAGVTSGALGLVAAGGVSGAISFLLPAIALALLAILTAVIILAARQAIIIILVMLAPLAFVAYLLPNTEKYFDKWKDLFVTMLVFFPLFAVIFGGSQLAGTAIIQSANSSIVVLILGMAVQVVPLFFLPLVVKFSSGMMGTVASMVGDKHRGLVNQAQEFAKDRSENKRQAMLARKNPRRFGITSLAQRMEHGKRNRELERKGYETDAEAVWMESKKYKDLHAAQERAGLNKQIAEAAAEEHVEAEKLVAGEMQDLDIKARAGKLDVDVTQAKVESNWEGIRAGYNPNTGNAISSDETQRSPLEQTIAAAQINSRDLALAGLRKQSAERARSNQLTQDLLKDNGTVDGQVLSEYAGGVLGATGEESVRAGAVHNYRKENKERIGERTQLMYHFNISSSEKQKLAMGEDNVTRTKDGVTYTFKIADEFTREAAIDEQLKKGSFGEIEKIIMASGVKKDSAGNVIEKGVTHEFASSISDAIVDYKLAGKAAYYGSRTINDVAQGNVFGPEGLDNAAVFHLMNGKLKDNDVAAMDANALKRLFEVSVHDANGVPTQRAANSADYQGASSAEAATFRENAKILRHSAYRILENPLLRNATSEASKKVLEDYAKEPSSTTAP